VVRLELFINPFLNISQEGLENDSTMFHTEKMKSANSRFFPFALVSSFLLFAFSLGMPLLSSSQRPIEISSLTGEYDQTDTRGEFQGISVLSPLQGTGFLASSVLGDTDQPKRIEVNLATQTLSAFEGDHKVYEFLISSGKWARTPTGTFHIWGKFRYTKMSGGNKLLHTYYYLPNVPYVMFFDNDEVAASRGFSIHGTYWHENFGHPMSHGCINMKTEEAEKIFYWTNPTVGGGSTIRASEYDPGTEIVIYGVAPRE
jgi:lipoprotein-anchoring transpeptidase ErfK/SrfK